MDDMDKLLHALFSRVQRREDLENVPRLLRQCLERLREQAETARAVWHPLGFMCVYLLREGRKSLRLHVWSVDPPEIKKEMSQIHDHIWSLASYVLCGHVINHNVVLAPDSNTPSHRLYQVLYDGRANNLQPTEVLVDYGVESSQQVSAGNVYKIEPGRFHFTEAAEGQTTATLVAAEDLSQGSPTTLGPVEGSVRHMERQKSTMDEVRRVITEVLETMKSP